MTSLVEVSTEKKHNIELDYTHSPAHGCITQPPCVVPSGDSGRVIA